MNTEHLVVKIATWMLASEAILVVIFVLINYGIRFYHQYIMREKIEVDDKVKSIFFKCIRNNDGITQKDLLYFKKHILHVFKTMEKFEVSNELEDSWKRFQEQLVLKLFYPRGKALYNSWRPYKRYYAARCFLAHYEPSDADMVVKLIADPVLLVALNSSRIAFKYQSPVLINASIDVFSKYRKMRQSIYSTISRDCSEQVPKIIVDRMMIEKDPYIKGFCYRLLQQMPPADLPIEMLKLDLNASVVDLRVAALHYCGYDPEFNHYLGKYIDDEQWQMRAVAAEWIGRAQYYPAVPVLAKRLSDHEWWVRIRAAEALGKCGEMGISYLRNQTEFQDKYAYEAARQVLDTIGTGGSLC